MLFRSVTLKPRRGCYVTEISERDLDEVFSIMALLEGECVRIMVERASDAQLDELKAIHAELERAAAARDIKGFFEANQAFHLALQEIADNRWLLQVIEDLVVELAADGPWRVQIVGDLDLLPDAMAARLRAGVEAGIADGSIRPDIDFHMIYQILVNAYTGTNIYDGTKYAIDPVETLRTSSAIIANYIKNDT